MFSYEVSDVCDYIRFGNLEIAMQPINQYDDWKKNAVRLVMKRTYGTASGQVLPHIVLSKEDLIPIKGYEGELRKLFKKHRAEIVKAMLVDRCRTAREFFNLMEEKENG